jgi:hypothetical protein
MSLYLLKAKVTKRVFGISGPFQSTESKLVHANNVPEAKGKFEINVRAKAANMQCDSIEFEYLEIIDEIL